MTRVEWSRRSGDDVEATVAMFLSCDFPHAQRITPSKGDAGIDVLVKTGNGYAIYQVKSFTGPLKSGQKRQVEKSMRALVTDPRVSDLHVEEWHLVTAWDPTHEALTWLCAYAAELGLPEPDWEGLTQCDQWAAAYPHVVDYYINGNREYIDQQVKGLLNGLRIGSWADNGPPADIDVQTLSDGVCGAVEFLNDTDPFYRYDLSVASIPAGVEVGREPTVERLKSQFGKNASDSVMSWVREQGSMRLRIDVCERTPSPPNSNPSPSGASSRSLPGPSTRRHYATSPRTALLSTYP